MAYRLPYDRFVAAGGGVRRAPLIQPHHGHAAFLPHDNVVQEIMADLLDLVAAAAAGGVPGGGPRFQHPHGLLFLPYGAAARAYLYAGIINGIHQNSTQDLTTPERDGGLSMEVIRRSLMTRSCSEAAAAAAAATATTADEKDICVVCQDDLCQENQMTGVLNCGHEFHASCIEQWLQRKNICPLCKALAL